MGAALARAEGGPPDERQGAKTGDTDVLGSKAERRGKKAAHSE